MSVDATAFKRGMRHLAASVTLITTRHRDLRGGLTATAVCSVSAEPPQILVCVNKTASALDPVGEAGFFCVNILSADQQDISDAMATKGGEKFDGVDWRPSPTGSPVIDGVLGYVDCTIDTVHEAGDHYIVVGRVKEDEGRLARLSLRRQPA